MNREQALETLKEMAFTATESYRQALETAISALSDYDKMQKISLDLAFENDELMNKSRWIPVNVCNPKGTGFVADDGLGNYPWVCTSLAELQSEDGVKHFYDSDGYQDYIIRGDIKGFLKGKKAQTCSGMTVYIPPREIVAWMPLPEPYNADREVSE